jgi:hypothetical protein
VYPFRRKFICRPNSQHYIHDECSVVLVSNLSCKELFLDDSGRLYIEQNEATKNDSFVYDLYGILLASCTSGSKLIVKASKYTLYLLKIHYCFINIHNKTLFLSLCSLLSIVIYFASNTKQFSRVVDVTNRSMMIGYPQNIFLFQMSLSSLTKSTN